MVGDAAKAIEGFLEVLGAGAKSVSKVAKMAEIGCGIITIIDQATSGVYEASSNARDDHDGNVNAKDIIRSPAKKDKATKRFRPTMMKAGWLAPFNIRFPSIETCSLLLEEYMPPEYKEELL